MAHAVLSKRHGHVVGDAAEVTECRMISKAAAIMLVGDHAANHRRDCMYAFSNHQFSRWIRASGRRAQKNCLRRRVLTEKCFCEYVVNQAMLQGMVRDDHRCAPELISFRKTAFLPHVPSDFSACGTISCLAAVLPAPGGVQKRPKQSWFGSLYCCLF